MRLQLTLCYMEPPCSAPLERVQLFFLCRTFYIHL